MGGLFLTSLNFIDEIQNDFSFGSWAKPNTTITLKSESATTVAGTTGQRYLFYPFNPSISSSCGTGLSVGTNGVSVFEHSAGYMPCLLTYSSTISDTQFTNFMVVYRNKQPTLYINGELVRTGLQSNKTYVSPSNIAPGGGYIPYETFYGEIVSVYLYNRSLSDLEILQNYNVTKSRFGL